MRKIDKQVIIAIAGIFVLLFILLTVKDFKESVQVALDSKSQVAALGTLGSLEKTNNGKGEFPSVELPRSMRGKEALLNVREKLPEIAAWYNMSPRALQDLLENDEDVWMDQEGRVLYVDEQMLIAEGTGVSGEDNFAGGANYPLDQTFKLHSRPGSKRTVYIDFDGGSVSGTSWNNSTNGEAIVYPAYDLDGNQASFSDTELAKIQDIWKRVSEDYAPFDVDVTTEFVSWDLINKDNLNDEYFGIWIAVDDSSTHWYSGGVNVGGVAYYHSFDGPSSTQPAWVFRSGLGGGSNTKYMAEAISHEVGHTLGLYHDGDSSSSYYYGHNNWAPIMGVGYHKPITQFSKGEYSGANNTQDDFVQMQQYISLVDDHGNTTSQASSLSILNNNVSAKGVINSQNDKDVFSFITSGGSITLNFTPGPGSGANLDISVELLNGNGSRIITSDSTSLSTSLGTNLSAGTYYIVVDGVGTGDPSTGYSDYGSAGQYSISGVIPSSGDVVPPVASISVSPVSGPNPLDVNFSSVNSYDQDGSIVKYTWSFGDGSTSVEADPFKTYSEPGSYEAVLTVEDNSGLTDSASVTINVTNDSPIASLSATPVEGELPLVVEFDASGSSDPDGTIVDYVWDFRDGFTESGSAQISHTYNTEGNYTPFVSVYDNFGQIGYAYVTIKVLPSTNFLAAPSNISATLAGDNAIVSWDYTGSKQDGFYIERGTKNRGKYTWERVGSVDSVTRSYADMSITEDQYYRVQAFNADEVSEYTSSVLVRYSVDGGGGGSDSGKPEKCSPWPQCR